MAQRLLTSALFAGFAAGLIAALLQLALIQPVLLEAELYEAGELIHFNGPAIAADEHAATGHDHADGSHGHDPAGTAASGIDLKRDGLSVLFTTLIYTGYAFLLLAAMALAEERGATVTARRGLVWGLCGFLAVQLAPAIGLSPELPGMAAGDLAPRQVWWFGTVAATAAALWLIAFGQSWTAWGMAVVLLALPHVIGAPQPADFTGPTPPELASAFAGRALGVGLASWAVLGLFAGYFWQRETTSVGKPSTA